MGAVGWQYLWAHPHTGRDMRVRVNNLVGRFATCEDMAQLRGCFTKATD